MVKLIRQASDLVLVTVDQTLLKLGLDLVETKYLAAKRSVVFAKGPLMAQSGRANRADECPL